MKVLQKNPQMNRVLTNQSTPHSFSSLEFFNRSLVISLAGIIPKIHYHVLRTQSSCSSQLLNIDYPPVNHVPSPPEAQRRIGQTNRVLFFINPRILIWIASESVHHGLLGKREWLGYMLPHVHILTWHRKLNLRGYYVTQASFLQVGDSNVT